MDTLLPLMEKWIREKGTSPRRIFGLVILIEASKKFGEIFSTIENRNLVRKIIISLENLLEKPLDVQLDLGDSIKMEEIVSLRNFLFERVDNK
jgi:hypothetical protein